MPGNQQLNRLYFIQKLYLLRSSKPALKDAIISRHRLSLYNSTPTRTYTIPPPHSRNNMSRTESKNIPTIVRSDTYTREEILGPQGNEQTRPRASTTATDSSKHGWRKMLFGHRRNHSVPVNSENSEMSAEDRAIALALDQAPNTQSRSRRASYTTPPEESEFNLAIKLHNNKDYQKSTEILRSLANPSEGNHPKSQIMFGLALQNGWGTDQDMEEGFEYLKLAAYNSASIPTVTPEEKINAKKAMNHALYEIGNSYMYGRGVKQSRSEAFKYYKTGADNGDGDCQLAYAMALYGENGNHVSKADKMEAAKYFRMGEEQGYTIPSNTWFHKDKWMPK
ncbi:hypothetical protein BZA77DRAFT_322213 [Pyronema omphalodes]|nr:hypothetical protein BZA77DRAFT_322213 [Pyronema omphalodes]